MSSPHQQKLLNFSLKLNLESKLSIFKNLFTNGLQKYEGHISNSQTPEGYGTTYYSNGNIKYVGEWKNGQPHGKGKKYYTDGLYQLIISLLKNSKKINFFKILIFSK